jgi:L-asparaginase
MTKPNILLIYTGGTIGMVKDYKTNSLKAFDFDNLRNHIPELNQIACNIKTVSFEEPIDSSNMNSIYVAQIATIIEEHYLEADGFVVLSGSDTMSYTSSALSFMLENLCKAVVFTGSQLPIGDLRTDAKENLITAIQVASSFDKKGRAMVPEVSLYFEYKLYRANRTTKINAEHFEAFASPNYPDLAVSGVHLKFNKPYINKHPKDKKLIVRKDLVDDIVVLKLFPGITQAVVDAILAIPSLKGVVLETFGAGNAPTASWFVKAVKKAVKNGIVILDVTQCVGGAVILGHYETSLQLKKVGVLSGKDITTEAALAKMMYLLTKDLTKSQQKKYFEKSLRGEMQQ